MNIKHQPVLIFLLSCVLQLPFLVPPDSAAGSGTDASTPHQVVITNKRDTGKRRFNPRVLRITIGESVEWINEDDHVHVIKNQNNSGGQGDGEEEVNNRIDSGELQKFETWEEEFSKPGVVPYYCPTHPLELKGVIIVQSPYRRRRRYSAGGPVREVLKEKDARALHKKRVLNIPIDEALKKGREKEAKAKKSNEEWLAAYKKEDVGLKTVTGEPDLTPPSALPEGMVFIPGGPFLRGQDWGSDTTNQPSRIVELSPYYIDRLEVTVDDFKSYLYHTRQRIPYFLYDSELGQKGRPVFKVSWYRAGDYCAYHGKRLPTEAEWEKAARGWDDRYFPWGNELPDSDGEYRANYAPKHRFDDGFSLTAPVGSFPTGGSPYGVLDMAGNIAEWTADWFDPVYYMLRLTLFGPKIPK